MASKPTALPSASLPDVLKETMIGIVRRGGADLRARQLAILLISYLNESETQTVRGLAAQLEVDGPSVTGSLNRLSQFRLVRRVANPNDRRSVLIGHTRAGRAYMAMLRELLVHATRRPPSPRVQIA